MQYVKQLGRAILQTTFGEMNIPLIQVDNFTGNPSWSYQQYNTLYGDTFMGFSSPSASPSTAIAFNTLGGQTGTVLDIIGENLHHTIVNTTFSSDTIVWRGEDNLSGSGILNKALTYYYFGLPVMFTIDKTSFLLGWFESNSFNFNESTVIGTTGHFSNISVSAKSNGTVTFKLLGTEIQSNDIMQNGSVVLPDPYNVIIPESENTTPQGTGDLSSVDIPVPTPPTINICDTKFISLYSPTLAQLQALASYMWSDSSFDISNFQKLFADPMECILGLIMLPFTVPTSGSSNIQVGNMATNVSANNVSAQYFQVNCGSITIDRFTGSYLDFEPYTKAQIFLPYIGIQDLSVDDIMGKTIYVTYNVDVLTGACIAFIKCGGSVLYQFIGQCGANIPITSNTYTGVIQSLLDLTRSLTHVAGGDMVGGLSGVASASVNINKPKIQKSGTLSGVGGFLGIQYPYIILTKPNPAIPKDQNKYLGYPSYVTKQVGSCIGFTQFETVYLENMSCNETEKEEILNLLKEGVIL